MSLDSSHAPNALRVPLRTGKVELHGGARGITESGSSTRPCRRAVPLVLLTIGRCNALRRHLVGGGVVDDKGLRGGNSRCCCGGGVGGCLAGCPRSGGGGSSSNSGSSGSQNTQLHVACLPVVERTLRPDLCRGWCFECTVVVEANDPSTSNYSPKHFPTETTPHRPGDSDSGYIAPLSSTVSAAPPSGIPVVRVKHGPYSSSANCHLLVNRVFGRRTYPFLAQTLQRRCRVPTMSKNSGGPTCS